MAKPPRLKTTHWFNTTEKLTLEGMRGRVVLVEVFQMLCPRCVAHGLPQAQRVANAFKSEDIAVIGLHSVFEHHEAQGAKEALAAFLHEYRISFPVGIDAPSGSGGLPQTMAAYGMQGTPTLLLFDRAGTLRKHKFGIEDDLVLGAEIMSLINESGIDPALQNNFEDTGGRCDEHGCAVLPARQPGA